MIGPTIPATAESERPTPRTTVGYSSAAISGSTTKADEMPNLPMQYRTRVTVVSVGILKNINGKCISLPECALNVSTL